MVGDWWGRDGVLARGGWLLPVGWTVNTGFYLFLETAFQWSFSLTDGSGVGKMRDWFPASRASRQVPKLAVRGCKKPNMMRDGFPLSDHFGNPGTWVDENSLVGLSEKQALVESPFLW